MVSASRNEPRIGTGVIVLRCSFSPDRALAFPATGFGVTDLALPTSGGGGGCGGSGFMTSRKEVRGARAATLGSPVPFSTVFAEGDASRDG